MKFPTISERERRTIVMAVIAVGLPLAYVKGIVPYREALTDARDRLAAERASLARDLATVGGSSENPAAMLTVDSAMQAMRPRLFTGSDDVAPAELSSYVAELAARNSTLLQSATTRPTTVSPTGVRTLRVEIRAESDLRGILRFLSAVDQGPRFVRFERLEISRPGGADDDAEVEVLTVSAVVTGYSVGDPPAAQPARGAGPAGRGGRG